MNEKTFAVNSKRQTRGPTLGNVNAIALAADCPVCGASCPPYEINVNGWGDVFCRYQCFSDEAPCEVCGGCDDCGPTKDCEECEGRGTMRCQCHYAGDGETSTWEE